MFQFTTTTVINSLNTPGFGTSITSKTGGTEMNNHRRFWVEAVAKTGEHEATSILRIAHDFRFDKANVVSIYKRPYKDPSVFSVTFDLASIIKAATTTTTGATPVSTVNAGVGRIKLYIRLSGSNNSLYSNDMVFKGKPFYLEFPIKDGDTATALGDRIVANAKRLQSLQYGEILVNIFNTAGVITMTGTDEYQVVKEAELQWYNEDAQSYDCCAKFGAYEDNAEGTIVTQGNEGFGTYRQLIKNLRLPTAANTRWTRIAQDETPIVNGMYNEYIIKMCVNRGIMGSSAVGEEVTSTTTHVFYVLKDISSTFETALGSIGTIIVVNKDQDDVAQTQDALDAAVSAEKIAAVETAAHGTDNSDPD